MHEARPDELVKRFTPDPQLLACAHNAMLDSEHPRVTFVRQRWEHASGAIRVALDELREIFPCERELLSEAAAEGLQAALESVTIAYMELDRLAEEMLGHVMHAVLLGAIDNLKDLEATLDK